MLVGSYTHNIDAKGRIFIPAKYRDDLGSHVYMFYLKVENCVRVYSETMIQEFIESLSQTTAKDNDKIRRLTARISDVEADSQGRILIPEALRGKLGITDKVVISGAIDRVEIWNPQTFAERIANDEDDDDQDVLDMFAEHGMH